MRTFSVHVQQRLLEDSMWRGFKNIIPIRGGDDEILAGIIIQHYTGSHPTTLAC